MVEILKNVNALIRGFGYLFNQFTESRNNQIIK